jgi:hypothetical protein
MEPTARMQADSPSRVVLTSTNDSRPSWLPPPLPTDRVPDGTDKTLPSELPGSPAQNLPWEDSGFPTDYSVSSPTIEFGANFDNPSFSSAFLGAISQAVDVLRDGLSSTKGSGPDQTFPDDPVPSEPGDYPEPGGPEDSANQTDRGSPPPSDPDDPSNPTGPGIGADDPEDDYGGALRPGQQRLPGAGAGSPSRGGRPSGSDPEPWNPFGSDSMPNPFDGGPAGPNALGMNQAVAGTVSVGRVAATWTGGLTAGLRAGL